MKQSKELDVAIEAAKAGGREIMRHYGKLRNVRKKSDRLGPVTEADLAAQKKIKSIILKAFPSAAILAEESQSQPAVVDGLWIVDPLDGTNNFSRGLKEFAVSIGLWRMGGVALGVIFNPITKDLFCAERGKGAFLNGKHSHVSGISSMESSLTGIGLPKRTGVREENYAMLQKLFANMGSLRHFGAAALEFAYISAGWTDSYIEAGLFPWDTAAGVLIVQEAGGKVTNEKGKPFNIFNDRVLVASNGKIHSQILRGLNGK